MQISLAAPSRSRAPSRCPMQALSSVFSHTGSSPSNSLSAPSSQPSGSLRVSRKALSSRAICLTCSGPRMSMSASMPGMSCSSSSSSAWVSASSDSISSSVCSIMRKFGSTPAASKLIFTAVEQKECRVEICARSSFSSCNAIFSSPASASRLRRLYSLSFMSALEARVNVTISMFSMSAPSCKSPSTRSTSTVVFPLPAAADTSRFVPRAPMALNCWDVKPISHLLK